ncbi:MAG TPA: MBL fold metallo-hydrolase [Rhizomicrobium sp.]|jgi:glyoxylase-like metal-dependent hydrolase (beta-lactamase superfamily II)|nr:MBL fold metallo-hydrolase [Rhizomicrobium sp.]
MRLALALAFIAITSAPAFAASDGFARITVPVSPHVHLIQRPIAQNAPYEGNVEVIEQSDGLVVVDAGGSPPSGVHVVEQIKALTNKPVKYLIYTHYHGDHNLGAGAFLAAWPNVTIVSTEATRVNMTTKPMDYIKTYSADYAGEIDYAKKQMADEKLPPEVRAGWAQYVDVGDSIIAGYKDMKAYPATKTFTDTFDIPDSQTPVEVRFLGLANTNGDAVVWVPSDKVLITGDIVVSPIPYAAASFPLEWIGVLNKLKAYDFAYLIPGHGDVQSDKSYLGELIAALEGVRAQVTPLARKGVKLGDVYKQTNFDAIKQTFAGSDPWLRSLLNSFYLRAVVKNAYDQATGTAIVQGTG